jgi:cation:H+ antiporter
VLILEFSAIVTGFALLVWGADRFVFGASGTANSLGVSPLIIGLVIIGFGTSAPEMLIGGFAAWDGNTNLAIGNAIGSNITNIALVLGATALVAPLIVSSDVLRREFPVLLIIMVGTLILFLDGHLGRIDGIILISGMVLFVLWMIHMAHKSRQPGAARDPLESELTAEIPKVSLNKALLWLFIGLAVLLAGAKAVVWGAVAVAQAFGISDLIIGLTIVAIGTSLPELAANIVSARKGEHDLAIGNIMGSNMFNLLGVLGLPAVIHPTDFEHSVLTRDFPIMIALTIALYLMARSRKHQHGHINRTEGVILLIIFISYLGLLYANATGMIKW